MAIVDRVKFDASSNDVLVWKFPSEELRLGTQLIVNESQEALLFKGGKALDLFGPGRHTLSTDNIPLIRRVVNLPFGGKTPFTAEVWYVNKAVRRGLKWGTRRPIPVIDPKFGYPISIRSFGQWGLRILDSRSFITQIVGTLMTGDSGQVEEYFGGEISQKLSNSLAKLFTQENISIFEANAHINKLSDLVSDEITPEFTRFGIEVVHFNVERISIPEEEQKKFQEILAKKMEIEQISQANVGQSYVTMRSLDAVEKAAENEGAAGGIMAGGVGLGMGLGAGMPLGQQIGKSMDVQSQEGQQEGAQTQQGQVQQEEKQSGSGTQGDTTSTRDSAGEHNNGAVAKEDPFEKLQKLKQMLEAGLIEQDDFEVKKKAILESM